MKVKQVSDECELKQAVDWLFNDRMFAGPKQHGNTDWSFPTLATMALLWAWGGEETLQNRFRRGLKILSRWFDRREWGTTYQGFLKALIRHHAQLLQAMIAQLRQQMRQVANANWTIYGWIVMAIDGTRIEAPRTSENEAWFARTPRKKRRQKVRKKRRRRASAGRRQTKQKRKTHPPAPQVWLTVMWHVGAGLLWDWRQGPNGSSERAHLLEMLDELPKRTLVTADAGFQGYEYWSAILEKGHSFLIRVGGNVRLLRGLGYVRRTRNIVYLWPKKASRRGEPPIVLRLIEFHDGRRSIWLVTSILDREQLSDKQGLEIYRLRWGVEVFFRGFKQKFGRGKLRSHAPQNVELELDWSLLALWSLELLAVRELLLRGQQPCDLSTTFAIRAVREALQCASVGVHFDLFSQLAAIRQDGYFHRRKNKRRWPRKKSEPPVKSPCIRLANTEEIKAAYQIQKQAA